LIILIHDNLYFSRDQPKWIEVIDLLTVIINYLKENRKKKKIDDKEEGN